MIDERGTLWVDKCWNMRVSGILSGGIPRDTGAIHGYLEEWIHLGYRLL